MEKLQTYEAILAQAGSLAYSTINSITSQKKLSKLQIKKKTKRFLKNEWETQEEEAYIP